MALTVDRNLVIPDAELQWRFSTSGGPGGQHANRANTRVELIWSVVDSAVVNGRQRRMLTERLGDEVRVVVDEHRSQSRNRDAAARKLAQQCRQALRPVKRRKPTRPTRGSQRRRLKRKKQHSEKKRMRQRPRYDS